MIEPVADLSPAVLALYDDVIDVRSPAEFAEDRLPRALNLPVLSNEERAEIGTIYVQEQRFKARRMGAALVARNVAGHLEAALAGKAAKWRPLLYCWRGGMRSRAMATILSEIGWRVGVVEGGYKTWRRRVVETLHGEGEPFPLLLIDGATGTGKSAIVRRLIELGAAAIALEALAAHRVSVFGGLGAEPQPSQKRFESRLYETLSRISRGRSIVVEAESAQIGRCVLPSRFWRSMRGGAHVVVRAELEPRARYTLAAYRDLLADPPRVVAAIERLRPLHAKKTVEAWLALAAAGRYEDLAGDLMREHYDPLYRRAGARRIDPPRADIDLGALEADDIDRAAQRIRSLI